MDTNIIYASLASKLTGSKSQSLWFLLIEIELKIKLNYGQYTQSKVNKLFHCPPKPHL